MILWTFFGFSEVLSFNLSFFNPDVLQRSVDIIEAKTSINRYYRIQNIDVKTLIFFFNI